MEIDYETLAAVTSTAEAVAQGAPAVWDECRDNVCFVQEVGNKAAAEAAFASATHVVKERFHHHPRGVISMEPREAVGSYD